MLSAVSSRVGNYELIRIIGNGAFAQVWLGRHIITGTSVAIKVIARASLSTPDAMTRFTREVSLMKQMRHPFIAELFQVIQTPTAFYLVTEYVDHGSMLEYINNQGSLPEEEARRYFTELVCALDYLHNKKFVAHRDLKSENILLGSDGSIRLIDFGLSREFTKTCPDMRSACGSPAYAAPEMIQGHPYTKAADMWSAGVVLYAMVCGRLPFEDDSIQTLLQKVVYTEAQFPESLSRSLVDLLRRLLAKTPEERITLSRVKEHPWLANSRYAGMMDMPWGDEKRDVDREIVEKMQILGINCKGLAQNLLADEWNEVTAVYNMMRKQNMIGRVRELMASVGLGMIPCVSLESVLRRLGTGREDSPPFTKATIIRTPGKAVGPRRMSRPVTLAKRPVMKDMMLQSSPSGVAVAVQQPI